MTSKKQESTGRRKAGFSLIEVSLAVLLIGMGVLTLFSLFPAGLKQSENAMMDTHVGFFAEEVMNGFRANAYQLTNWSKWSDMGLFRSTALGANLVVAGENIYGDGATRTVPDFAGPGASVTYSLLVDMVSDHTNLRFANLKVCVGDRWVPDDAQWFYTEVFYPGCQ